MEITYEALCQKVGFDIDSYEPEVSDYENDSRVSPFLALSDAELQFLIDRRMSIIKMNQS